MAGRETIAGGEQHVPMCPDEVGRDPAATVTLLSDVLADLSEHLVGALSGCRCPWRGCVAVRTRPWLRRWPPCSTPRSGVIASSVK
jgi:hypothetical protein